LAGAVEMAVRDVTGKVVREAVEATLREVVALRKQLSRRTHVADPAYRQFPDRLFRRESKRGPS
jgi:hypothetical protein